MRRNHIHAGLCWAAVLLGGMTAALAQTTGGLDDSVTTPPTTTDTSTGSTGSTGGGSIVLTPRNSVANTPQYNNAKARTKQFQFPSGSNLVSAELATGENAFRDSFLIPMIESIFEELQNFIVDIVASSIIGNALPPTTSAPA